jgi:hypothetical protein
MRSALASSLAALSLVASASPAGAAVTIGQLAPDGTLSQCNFAPTDNAQAGYVVPPLPPASALVISSWSYNAGAGPGQTITMKVFRKIADPATLQVVGHDGPRAIAADTLNTFPANVPVQPGDILGSNQPTSANTACVFFAPGDTRFQYLGDLSDGQSAAFTAVNMPPSSDYRLNVSAVVQPSNSFGLGAVARNKKKGTATLKVNVPNPGELIGSGNGAKVAAAEARISKAVTPGAAQLLIKAKGKKKKKLNQKGKVKLNVAVTYTPTGGDPRTQSVKVKLKKL